MKYTRSQLIFGAASLFFFPASFVFVWFLIDNPKWCLADMCVDRTMHNMGPTLKYSLIFYYAFLIATLAVSEAARRIPRLQRILSRTITKTSTISVAELTWFILALVVAAGCAAMGFFMMWNNMVAKLKPGKTINYLFSTVNYLFNVSGDALAVLMGFVMIPVSKNSFLATFFDLPYTAMARVHIWIGRVIWWLTVFHTVDGIMKYVLNNRDPLNMIRVPKNPEWGDHDFVGVTGIVATAALLIITLTSLDFVRRKYFNVFFYTHFLVFIFILFAYFHASNCIYYILPGLFMYTVDGFMRLYSRYSPRDKVSNVIFEDCGYVTLTIATKKAATVRPGEFMRVCFPEVSKYEFHPWSVVRANAESVTFLFATASENQKEWTWKLQALLVERKAAGTVDEVEVCLQGPFGSEIGFLNSVGVAGKKTPDMYVFYVGGTGLAASVQGVEKILAHESTKVLLVWSARVVGMENLSLVKELIAKGKQTGGNLSVELYETRGDAVAQDPESIENLTATKLMSEKNLEEVGLAGHQLHHQRSDLLAILQKHVSVVDLDTSTVEVGLFVCGSGGLTKHALQSSTQFQRDNKNVQINLVVEPFAL